MDAGKDDVMGTQLRKLDEANIRITDMGLICSGDGTGEVVYEFQTDAGQGAAPWEDGVPRGHRSSPKGARRDAKPQELTRGTPYHQADKCLQDSPREGLARGLLPWADVTPATAGIGAAGRPRFLPRQESGPPLQGVPAVGQAAHVSGPRQQQHLTPNWKGALRRTSSLAAASEMSTYGSFDSLALGSDSLALSSVSWLPSPFFCPSMEMGCSATPAVKEAGTTSTSLALQPLASDLSLPATRSPDSALDSPKRHVNTTIFLRKPASQQRSASTSFALYSGHSLQTGDVTHVDMASAWQHALRRQASGIRVQGEAGSSPQTHEREVPGKGANCKVRLRQHTSEVSWDGDTVEDFLRRHAAGVPRQTTSDSPCQDPVSAHGGSSGPSCGLHGRGLPEEARGGAKKAVLLTGTGEQNSERTAKPRTLVEQARKSEPQSGMEGQGPFVLWRTWSDTSEVGREYLTTAGIPCRDQAWDAVHGRGRRGASRLAIASYSTDRAAERTGLDLPQSPLEGAAGATAGSPLAHKCSDGKLIAPLPAMQGKPNGAHFVSIMGLASSTGKTCSGSSQGYSCGASEETPGATQAFHPAGQRPSCGASEGFVIAETAMDLHLLTTQGTPSPNTVVAALSHSKEAYGSSDLDLRASGHLRSYTWVEQDSTNNKWVVGGGLPKGFAPKESATKPHMPSSDLMKKEEEALKAGPSPAGSAAQCAGQHRPQHVRSSSWTGEGALGFVAKWRTGISRREAFGEPQQATDSNRGREKGHTGGPHQGPGEVSCSFEENEPVDGRSKASPARLFLSFVHRVSRNYCRKDRAAATPKSEGEVSMPCPVGSGQGMAMMVDAATEPYRTSSGQTLVLGPPSKRTLSRAKRAEGIRDRDPKG